MRKEVSLTIKENWSLDNDLVSGWDDLSLNVAYHASFTPAKDQRPNSHAKPHSLATCTRSCFRNKDILVT